MSVRPSLALVLVFLATAVGAQVPPIHVDPCDAPVAIDSCEAWVGRYAGPINGWDAAYAVAASNGMLYVAGLSEEQKNGFNYDVALFAIDPATGNETWAARWGGAAAGWDDAWAVTTDSKGDIIIAGSTWSGPNDSDFLISAFNHQSGAPLWTNTADGSAHGADLAFALTAAENGSVVVAAGISEGVGTSFDYWIVGVEVATGSTVWEVRYDGPVSGADHALAMTVSPEGSTVYVTGRSVSRVSPRNVDFATVAVDASNGIIKWVSWFDGPGHRDDVPWAIASSDQRVFVVGYASNAKAGEDMAVVAYDAQTGAELWSLMHNGPGNHDDVARAIAVADDQESVLVAGSGFGGESSWIDILLLNIEAANGVPKWTNSYSGMADFLGQTSGQGGDFARAAVLSDDESLFFVSGNSWGGDDQSYDFLTLAVAVEDGHVVWASRHDGFEGNLDIPWGMADVSELGKVVVVGESVGPAANSDFLVVTYDERRGATLG